MGSLSKGEWQMIDEEIRTIPPSVNCRVALWVTHEG
jgi:hypothetical protein